MKFEYSNRYYAKRVGDERHSHTAAAIQKVCQQEGLIPKSVLDVGCASGSLLQSINEIFQGSRLVGIDHGDYPKSTFTKVASFVDLDLDTVNEKTPAGEERLQEGFDVVVSVEVVEHVDPLNEKGLVAMLSSLTNRLLFLSAAHPGQRGYGHINCVSKAHWIDLFKPNQMVLAEKATALFIEIMESSGAGEAANLMVFQKNVQKELA